MKQEMTGWQWHQLDNMQIIRTSLQTDNHADTSPVTTYRLDALPDAQPTGYSTEGPLKPWKILLVLESPGNYMLRGP